MTARLKKMIVCLFDIDGTLVHTRGAGTGALAAAMAAAFGVAAPVASVPVHGRTDRAICSDLFAAHAIESTEDNWTAFRTAYLESLGQMLSTRDRAALPGVRELLDELHRRPDVRLGLLTGNNRAGAEIKLRHYGLDHFFEFGGFGDTHHDRDDVARSALQNARESLADPIDPKQLWVIGDTPADIQCGRAIGARVAAVATGQHTLEELQRSQPDLALESLAEWSALCELWR